MHMWQLCHLAMVVPIADAYYEADCLEKAGKEWKTERKTAKRLSDIGRVYKRAEISSPMRVMGKRAVSSEFCKKVSDQ